MCLEWKKIGNDLIYKLNYIFGIEKNEKGIDFPNPMESYSFYFEILLFLLEFDGIWIDFNFKYLKRLFYPS